MTLPLYPSVYYSYMCVPLSPLPDCCPQSRDNFCDDDYDAFFVSEWWYFHWEHVIKNTLGWVWWQSGQFLCFPLSSSLPQSDIVIQMFWLQNSDHNALIFVHCHMMLWWWLCNAFFVNVLTFSLEKKTALCWFWCLSGQFFFCDYDNSTDTVNSWHFLPSVPFVF